MKEENSKNLKTMKYYRYKMRFSGVKCNVSLKKVYHEYKFDPENVILLITGYSWVFYKKQGKGRNAEFFGDQDYLIQYEEFDDPQAEEKLLKRKFFDPNDQDWDCWKDVESHYAQRVGGTNKFEILR